MRIPERKPRGRRDLQIAYLDTATHALRGFDPSDVLEERSGRHAIGPLMRDVGEESLIYMRTTYHRDDWKRDRASIEGYVHDEFWAQVGRERVCITQAPRMVVDVSTFDPEQLVEVTVEGWGEASAVIGSLWGLVLCKVFGYHDPLHIGAGIYVCAHCESLLR